MKLTDFDCVVVGGGHAGASAALAAVESGCVNVLIVEKAPNNWVGGNGYFTAGAFRTVHGGLPDLLSIVCNVTPEQAQKIEIKLYSFDDFVGDILRFGDNKPDAVLVEAMVRNSRDAVEWLARVVDMYAVVPQASMWGRQKFWGGVALNIEDEGNSGLVKADPKESGGLARTEDAARYRSKFE